MEVNGDVGHTGPRRSQAARSAATRAALLRAARKLFAERGFAQTRREDLVAEAGVTRGALYHHFADKADAFRALYLELEEETVARVIEAAARRSDPIEQFRAGAHAFLDAALDPAVQRVMLIDAPSVLSWEVRREIEETHGLGLVRDVLRELMAAGLVAQQPVEPLAQVLLAALHEATLYVARAADPRKARREAGAIVDRMIDGLQG